MTTVLATYVRDRLVKLTTTGSDPKWDARRALDIGHAVSGQQWQDVVDANMNGEPLPHGVRVAPMLLVSPDDYDRTHAELADAERRVEQLRVQLADSEAHIAQMEAEHDHATARLERDAESILAPTMAPSALRRVS